MAVFEQAEARWGRPDYAAIAGRHGLLAVAQPGLEPVRRWLADHRYVIVDLDCDARPAEFRARVTKLLRWKEQFGYEPWRGSLDALRDGFEFDVPATGGLVLELKRFERLWSEDRETAKGLLAIACEYTHTSMAAGRRFLTLIGLPKDQPLSGETVDTMKIGSWWLPGDRFVPDGDQPA